MGYTVPHSLNVAYRHHLTTWIWVNTGSGNGLVPDGTKPLPESMWTNHHWDFVAIHTRPTSYKMFKISFFDMSLIITISISKAHLPGANKLKWSILFRMGISYLCLWDVLTIVILWWHFYLWSFTEHDGISLYIKFDKVARNIYYRYWQISFNRTAVQESPGIEQVPI